MEPKDWLPLIGVAVGWGLNQCGQWLVARRDERKAIGRALADLLEVRQRLLAIPKVVEVMAKRLANLPADAQAHLKVALGALFPPDERLSKRYEEAVNLVAGTNPLLGFRLRSQDVVGPFLHRLRETVLQDSPQSAEVFAKVEDYLIRQLSPRLEILILEVAWERDWITWLKTKRRLGEPLELPEDFCDGILAAISQPLASGQGSVVTKERKADSTQ